ncbi:MAG: tetratricopeptide repeat protein, partial [Bacteroidia bacterium]|nr:tetratricopeptide repeat protein [Bacteroidia bacterium]
MIFNTARNFLSGLFFIAAFCFCFSTSYSQNAKLDSLLSELKKRSFTGASSGGDTEKVKLLNDLSWEFKSIGSYDTAMNFAKAAFISASSVRIGTNSGWEKGIGKAMTNMANIYADKGDNDMAFEFYLKSLKSYEKTGDQKGMAGVYNNLGIVHADIGNYDKAIEFYFKALQIKETLGDKKGVANSYNNIGNIHANKNNYELAIEFYSKSLEIRNELGDKKGMAVPYSNIGAIYAKKGNYDKAIEFYSKSFSIRNELGDKKGMADLYLNIGAVHANKKEYEPAKDFYKKSLSLSKEIGYQEGVVVAYNNYGETYLEERKPAEAKKVLLEAAQVAKKIDASPELMRACFSLSECDSALGDFVSAYHYHKLFASLKDAITNNENNRLIAQMNAQYAGQKKDQAIELLNKDKENQRVIAAAESKKQKVILFSVCGFLLLVIGFAVFAWRSFLQKKKSNLAITKQKDIIEEKQKEILDSIYYARR